MLSSTVWAKVIVCDRTVVERVEYRDEAVVVHVRPERRRPACCGVCGRPAAGYDRGHGRRRWRSLDFGASRVWLEADAPRVDCPEHGPTVRDLPWARHGAGHTRAFDQQVAWLATQCSKTAVTQLLRITWRSVGSILARVWDEADQPARRLAGLRRIGIDEISYKRGHRYLTVVVDHDTGHLVWAAPGRDQETLGNFFALLGLDGCARITHVSADGADWIAKAVARHCPNAVRCADPFHVVKRATDALDVERRRAWNQARGRAAGKRSSQDARTLKHARFALWKNPENLTDKQQVKLAWIQKTDPRLHRAYLLKEGLRTVFQLDAAQAPQALDKWVDWARRCRIPAFVDLQRRLQAHKPSILAAIEHGLSNGRIESVNTKIRLITRRAFGFHHPEALISLAMLSLAGTPPALPGRT